MEAYLHGVSTRKVDDLEGRHLRAHYVPRSRASSSLEQGRAAYRLGAILPVQQTLQAPTCPFVTPGSRLRSDYESPALTG